MLFKSGNTRSGELPFKQGEAAAVDAVDRFPLASSSPTVNMSMSNYHDLWRKQCSVWIQSINRNKTSGSVQYDFEQHRLTLVPRSCYCITDDVDVPYIQLKPLIAIMDSALMEYEIRMDCSYKLAPTITIDRIHIYLDGAEAITQLALIVEPEALLLKGGLRTRA